MGQLNDFTPTTSSELPSHADKYSVSCDDKLAKLIRRTSDREIVSNNSHLSFAPWL